MSRTPSNDGLSFETATVKVGKATWKFRELSANEMDDIADKSMNPDKTINPRLNSRLLIAASSEEPKFTVEDVGSWPTKVLVQVLRAVQKLNTFEPDATLESEWLRSLGYTVTAPETPPNP